MEGEPAHNCISIEYDEGRGTQTRPFALPMEEHSMLNLICFHCSTTYERPPTPGALPRYCSDACKAAVATENRRVRAEARQRARLEAYRKQREQFLAGRTAATA